MPNSNPGWNISHFDRITTYVQLHISCLLPDPTRYAVQPLTNTPFRTTSTLAYWQRHLINNNEHIQWMTVTGLNNKSDKWTDRLTHQNANPVAIILTKPTLCGKWDWRCNRVTAACTMAHLLTSAKDTDRHIKMLGMYANLHARYGHRCAPASNTTDTSVSKTQSRNSNILLTPPLQRQVIWRTALFYLPITQTSERRSSTGYRVSCTVMTEQQTNSTHQASTLHTEVIWSYR